MRKTPTLAVLACVLTSLFSAHPARAQAGPRAQHDSDGDEDDDDDDDNDLKPSSAPADIIVAARRLDEARTGIDPSLGASSYSLSNETVESRPLGETGSISQILLQAPGVTSGGGDQISVRGSQTGVQYRINNVILPDGISDLGERLSPRLAERVELVTGALPAQYGLQAGGVVNVTTKNGTYGSGGQLELYGGSQGLFQPAVEYAGASGGTSYFVSSSYQRDDLGVPSPDGSSVPRHDFGEQLEGLAFIDHVIDSASRVSLVAGVSDERSQIPEAPVPKQEAPSVADLAVNAVDGGELRTADRYGALSYQRSDGAAAFQIAAFGRSSSRRLQPGSSAGLDATGFGGSLHETSWTAGLQAEGSYSLGARQTVRAGGVFSYDHLEETLDLAIARPEAAPELASGASGVHRVLGSVFLQDEWKPLQHLTINLGGRLDRVGGLADATRVVPRVSFVWRSGTGTTVHAGYSRYLVAPRLYPEGQLALVTQPLSGVGGTSKDRLHAETDAYFDAGVDQTFADLTLRLDLFDRQAQDMLSRLDAGSPLVIKPFNFRHGVIRGFDASATYSEGPLSVWANFTYLHAAATGITSGGAYLPMAFLADADAHLIRPDGTPARAASGGASYKIENLRISGDASYSSGARGVTEDGDLSQARIPNNVQVNLAAILRLNGIGDCPLDARVDLVNAFDRRNRLADDSDLGIAQWGPGRSIFVGVEQSF